MADEPEPLQPTPAEPEPDPRRNSEAGLGGDDHPRRPEVPPTGNTVTNLARVNRRIE
jgi:hypothetical protein